MTRRARPRTRPRTECERPEEKDDGRDAEDPSSTILAADGDSEALERIGKEMTRRYAGDDQIVCEGSSGAAFARLGEMRARGDDVALVLATVGTPGLTGEELRARVKSLYRHANRALLIEWGVWGDRPTAEAILRAMALGRMDDDVLKPWRSPDELFHRTISEFLHPPPPSQEGGTHEFCGRPERY